MYLDAVVIAGLVTVLLILGFFVGVALFVVRDQKLHGHNSAENNSSDKPPM
ncbi:cytochrome c oxidase subunit CcoM [Marinobacter alexandrii]|jgi:hypothetical protein|nr:cytochrome c oxidase subunit CcoM [Marinobacter alexandrii]